MSDCYCVVCNENKNKNTFKLFSPMVLCPTCGNKRCPHATHHDELCTNSNEPGQYGSIYGIYPNPLKPLRDFINSKDD